MAYQNKVNPLGELVAISAKGTLMGNRGQLHDADKRIGRRRWTTKSWVTCALQFNGWKREIMGAKQYTELFFLDEATALAAGHRPCATCRRDRFNAFVEAWRLGNCPDESLRLIGPVDQQMHADRTLPIGDRVPESVDPVPDGAMLTIDGTDFWLKWRGRFHLWSFDGYGPPQNALRDQMIVVTPDSTVRALTQGYRPDVHASIG